MFNGIDGLSNLTELALLSGRKSLENTCPLSANYFKCQGSNFNISQKTLEIINNVEITGPTTSFQAVYALK